MARDYVVKMSVEDNITGTVNKARQSVKEFTDESKRMDEIQRQFDRIQMGSMPLRKQLRELQKIMAEMNFKGLSNTQEFTAMAQYAGEVADAMGDARQAVNAFANDTMKLQATAQAFQVVAGGASIVTGTMGLLGVESDKVQQAMLKVQSALALVNGVQSIANLLNKDSALMLRIKQIALQANTKATVSNTVAEKASNVATTTNTVAQVANTASMTANAVATNVVTGAKNKLNMAVAVGKALMGDWTGLVLVGATALLGYSLVTSDTSKEVEHYTQMIDFAKRSQKDFNDQVGNTTGNLVGNFKKMTAEWKNLKTTAEKTAYIKKNKTAFEQLGLAITDLHDAEVIFVKHTDQVVKALVARARAEGATEAIKQRWAKYYSEDATKMAHKASNPNSNTNISGLEDQAEKDYIMKGLKPFLNKDQWKELKEKGTIPKQFNNYMLHLSKEYVTEYKKASLKEAEDFATMMEKEALEQSQEASKILAGIGIKESNGTGSSGGAGKKMKDLAKDFAQQFTKIKNDYINGTLGYDATEKQIEELNKKIQAKGLKPFDVKFELTKATEEKLGKDVQTALDKYRLNIFSRDQVTAEIEQANKVAQQSGLQTFNTKFLVDQVEIKKEQEEVEKLTERAKQLKYLIDHGKDSDGQHTKELTEINSKLRERGENEVKVITSIDRHKKAVQELEDEYDNFIYEVEHGLFKGDIDARFNEFSKKFKEKGVKLENPFDNIEYKISQNDFMSNLMDVATNSDEYLEQGKSALKALELPLKLGKISKEEFDKFKDQINEWLDKKGLPPLEIEFNSEGAIESLETFQEKMEGVQSTLEGMRGSIGNVFDDFIQLGKIFESNANAGQKAGAMLATVGQYLQQIGGDGALAKAGAIAATIGQLALTFATSLKNVSSPWEWIAASLAGVATMATVISQVQGFSTGGIVGGSSLVGDRILTGINSGEMILNKNQQKNLFNLLDGQGMGIGSQLQKVEFEISGKNLKGTLNNYNDRMTKLK